MEKLIELLERAGIRPTEFCRILGISKATYYNWIRGRQPYSHIVKGELERVIGLIETATDKGKLPINDSIKGSERLIVINAILKS